MTVEGQFGYVAVGTCSAHIADIAEAAAHVDVGRGGSASERLLADEVEGHSVHEVGTVGTLEEAEQGAVGALASGSRRIVDAGDDIGLTQVEAHPTEGLGIGAVVGSGVAIEGKRRLRLGAGEYHRAFQRAVLRRVIGMEDGRNYQYKEQATEPVGRHFCHFTHCYTPHMHTHTHIRRCKISTFFRHSQRFSHKFCVLLSRTTLFALSVAIGKSHPRQKTYCQTAQHNLQNSAA